MGVKKCQGCNKDLKVVSRTPFCSDACHRRKGALNRGAGTEGETYTDRVFEAKVATLRLATDVYLAARAEAGEDVCNAVYADALIDIAEKRFEAEARDNAALVVESKMREFVRYMKVEGHLDFNLSKFIFSRGYTDYDAKKILEAMDPPVSQESKRAA